LRDQFIDRQLAELSRGISRPELPDEERTELLRKQQALRERKRLPLAAASQVVPE